MTQKKLSLKSEFNTVNFQKQNKDLLKDQQMVFKENSQSIFNQEYNQNSDLKIIQTQETGSPISFKREGNSNKFKTERFSQQN